MSKHCVVCGKAFKGQDIMCVWCWMECADEIEVEAAFDMEAKAMIKESKLAVEQLLRKLGV